MNDNYRPGKLCGGILFDLMCLAKSTQRKSMYINGVGEGLLKEEHLFSAIIHAFTQPYEFDCSEVTDHTTIAAYKRCVEDNVARIDFKEEAFVQNAHESLYCHAKVLMALKKIVDTFVKSTIDAEILAKRIVNVILQDDTIGPDASFYFNIDNSLVKKSDLLNNFTKDLYVECVLFGAWYYVFDHKRRNTYCTWAFNSWFKRHGDNGSTYDFDESKFHYYAGIPQTYLRLPEFEIKTGKEKKQDLKIVVSSSNPLINSYGWYVEHATTYYSRINTILNPMGMDFYSFYVTCGVSDYNPKKQKESDSLIKIITPKTVTDLGHRISLIADGGYGKTLFLKHMLLCEKRFGNDSFVERTDLVPVLVNLNEYRNTTTDIESFVYKQISRFDNTITFEKLKNDLNEGIFLFLFDALDEIGDKDIMNFIHAINDFCSRYDKNYFIVSSRPSESCSMLTDFRFLQLQPFNKEKATKLINKFVQYPESIRNKFVSKFGYRLTDIEKNPLLLTIKFMVFANKNEFVDGDSYKFYQKAYETLYETHDKIDSHFVRSYKTKLSIKDFSLLMSEFCYISFFNHDYSFNFEDAEDIFETFNLGEKYNVCTEDFLYDLQNNLCLLYVEDDTYHFIHRSFQEYFAAFYLANQKVEFFKDPKNIEAIDNFSHGSFPQRDEDKPNNFQAAKYMFDMTTLSPVFNLMGQMKALKLINYLLLPKLKGIFDSPDKPVDMLTYLKRIYGTIECAQGNVEGEQYPMLNSDILEYIYSDIVRNEYTFHQTMIIHDADDFIVDRFYLMGFDKDNSPIYETDKTVEFNYADPYDDRKVPESGCTYKIPIQTLIDNQEKYAGLIDSLTSEFITEYNEFLGAYKKLLKAAEAKK